MFLPSDSKAFVKITRDFVKLLIPPADLRLMLMTVLLWFFLGRVIVSGAEDGLIAISSPTTGMTVRILNDHKGAPITDLHVSLHKVWPLLHYFITMEPRIRSELAILSHNMARLDGQFLSSWHFDPSFKIPIYPSVNRERALRNMDEGVYPKPGTPLLKINIFSDHSSYRPSFIPSLILFISFHSWSIHFVFICSLHSWLVFSLHDEIVCTIFGPIVLKAMGLNSR